MSPGEVGCSPLSTVPIPQRSALAGARTHDLVSMRPLVRALAGEQQVLPSVLEVQCDERRGCGNLGRGPVHRPAR
jgi:hypothetical protein